MGLVTQYSAERQKLRGRQWHERISAYVTVMRSLLGSRHRIAVAIDDGSKIEVIRALSVAICSNDYDETSGMMLKRSRLDGETLTLYAAKHRSGLGMVDAVGRILLGLGRNDPRLSILKAKRLTVSARRGQRLARQRRRARRGRDAARLFGAARRTESAEAGIHRREQTRSETIASRHSWSLRRRDQVRQERAGRLIRRETSGQHVVGQRLDVPYRLLP